LISYQEKIVANNTSKLVLLFSWLTIL
jgi:hypothetical protein